MSRPNIVDYLRAAAVICADSEGRPGCKNWQLKACLEWMALNIEDVRKGEMSLAEFGRLYDMTDTSISSRGRKS